MTTEVMEPGTINLEEINLDVDEVEGRLTVFGGDLKFPPRTQAYQGADFEHMFEWRDFPVPRHPDTMEYELETEVFERGIVKVWPYTEVGNRPNYRFMFIMRGTQHT